MRHKIFSVFLFVAACAFFLSPLVVALGLVGILPDHELIAAQRAPSTVRIPIYSSKETERIGDHQRTVEETGYLLPLSISVLNISSTQSAEGSETLVSKSRSGGWLMLLWVGAALYILRQGKRWFTKEQK